MSYWELDVLQTRIQIFMHGGDANVRRRIKTVKNIVFQTTGEKVEILLQTDIN